MIRNIAKQGLAALAAVVLAGCAYDGSDTVIPGPSGPGTTTGEKGGYTINVGTAGTRAQLEGNTWMWSPQDNVGFYIQDASTSAAVASNVKLLSLNESAATSAQFEGELLESQIKRISKDGSYNYYAFYPYSEDYTETAVTFSIPAEVTASPGDLNVPVFMKAKAGDRDALTYLLPDGVQFFTGERVNLAFEQQLSYIDLYLALNNMAQDVKKIIVTSSAGTLAGAFSMDVATGAVTTVSGSNLLVINLPGGFNASSSDVRVAVLPQVFPAGAKLKFVLETDERAFETTVDVGGKSFVKGQNQRMGLRALKEDDIAIAYNGGFNSSYDYYKVGDLGTANSMNGSMIYGNGANIIRYNPTGIPSARINEVGLLFNGQKVQVTSWDKAGQTFTVDDRTVAWGDYTAQLYMIYNGGTEVRSAVKTISVTGLPYSAVPPTEAGGWTQASWNIDWKSDCVRLGGTSGSGECTIYSPTFNIPANINIAIGTYSFIKASNIIWWQTTTFTVRVNGTNIISKDSGKDDTGTFYTLNGNGTFTPDSKSFSCKSSYSAAGPYVEIFNLSVNYR